MYLEISIDSPYGRQAFYDFMGSTMQNEKTIKKHWQPVGQGVKRRCLLVPLLLGLPITPAFAETYNECILRHVNTSDGSVTLNEIRTRCVQESKAATDDIVKTSEKSDVLARRVNLEKSSKYNPFAILPHKPNYLLPMSYTSTVNYDHVGLSDKTTFDGLSHTEVKFQVSLKAPLVEGVFNGKGGVYVAYTSTSWWQAYNSSHSSPFRETNHEPEAFIVFPTQYDVFGMNLRVVTAGISHQSNGRTRALSRSWNRVYVNFILEKAGYYVGFKPWWRIPEDKKENPDDAKGDDNPDIEKYMGYGELRVGYKMGESNLGVMLRNNLRSENKGAVQLDWSFPINQRFKGYVQYFNGYGESLIDYNSSVSRFSVGVMLTDWL